MTDNTIKLEKSDILKLEIETSDGIKTGEYLEFDLEDIELPLRYQELIEKEKKNREQIKNELLIIDKRQDVKGKKILTKNQEDKIRAINKFYQKEVEIYNMFLGKNGVQKLLNGRKLTWTSLKTIDTIIEKQIVPQLNFSMTKIEEKIKNTYKISDNEDDKELKLDE